LLAAQKLTAGFDNLREALALMTPGDARYRLSVSSSATIAERWLAPRLSEFLASHPEIDLRIDSTPHVFDEESSEFDFGLRYAPPSPAAREEKKLFGEVLVPLCAPQVVLGIGPLDNPDALANIPLLHADRSTSDPEWIGWEEWGNRFGYTIPQPRHGLRFTLTTLAIRSVLAGHGLFLGQLSIALPDLRAGRLVAPFGPSKSCRTGYFYRLVSTGSARRTPLQRAFADWIEAEADKTRNAMEAYLAA
jgi:LysR family glycine cleavage system transcriptional activator